MFVFGLMTLCIFLTSSDSAQSFKTAFSNKFKIDDKGLMKWFLGVSVEQLPEKITLSQKSYILDLLSIFGMSDCNPCALPKIANTRIDKSGCPELNSNEFRDLSKMRTLYMSLVGKLNYLSVVSRPDLSFVVSSLSPVLKNPAQEHWLLANQFLRYLKGSLHLCLVFKRSKNLELFGFYDSDWGGPQVVIVLNYRLRVVLFVGLSVNSKQLLCLRPRLSI